MGSHGNIKTNCLCFKMFENTIIYRFYDFVFIKKLKPHLPIE